MFGISELRRKLESQSILIDLLTKKVQELGVALAGIEARSFGYKDSDTIERLKKENIDLKKKLASLEVTDASI